MSLQDLEISDAYRSGKDSLLEDFYLPALRYAKSYDRAVGYFSSSLLIYALQGISSIVKNNGQIRLIIGDPITDEEYLALKQGGEFMHLFNVFSKELDDLLESTSDIEKYRMRLFTALVATGRLELKFAYRKSGMYHEKIGIIKDSYENKILFLGSTNETTNAMNSSLNYESFSVFKSWDKEIYKRFALEHENGFDSIWKGCEPGIVTLDLPSKLYEKIHNHHARHPVEALDLEKEIDIYHLGLAYFNKNYPLVPEKIKGAKFKLFDHQSEALRNWFDNGRTGLLALATGAGKTITSLFGVAKMFESASRPRRLMLVVSVPYVALAEQWVEELAMFNMRPVRCFSGKASWESRLTSSVNNLLSGNTEFISVVVVNKTLVSEVFQDIISRVDPSSLFFIGDECHRLGTELIAMKLPEAEFRMGLSATPFDERDVDEVSQFDDGSKHRLINYFGEIVARYPLEKALHDGVLTQYNYYLIVVTLTEYETKIYGDLSKEIGRLMAISEAVDNVALKNAIRKRNKIVSNAEEKTKALDLILRNDSIEDKKFTLFYVGEGKAGIEDDDDMRDVIEDESSQLDNICKVISKNRWKVSTFTAKENKSERVRIMRSFIDGSIDGLVSMRVLDEGIDLPKCQRAFILASSRNSRQFIQRRGRILRKFEGKELAHIYDFVVAPHQSCKDTNSVELLGKELSRAMNFIVLANNRKSAQTQASIIADEYNIDLMELSYE